MRSYRLLVPIAVAAVSTLAVTARASKKFEYHPAICQLQAPLSSGGSPHLEYDSMAVYLRGANLAVICPLDHVTLSDDTATSSWVVVTANITPTAGVSPPTCEFRTESDTMFISIPPTKFPAVNTAGQAQYWATLHFPMLSSVGPFGMRLLCNLGQDTKLGSIEVEVD